MGRLKGWLSAKINILYVCDHPDVKELARKAKCYAKQSPIVNILYNVVPCLEKTSGTPRNDRGRMIGVAINTIVYVSPVYLSVLSLPRY